MDQPFISPERWTKELVRAGFSKPDAIVLDDAAPYHVNAAIIVRRESPETSPSRVTLLCHTPDGPYVQEVRDDLEALDVTVDLCRFGQDLSPRNDVISLLDLQEPILHGMSEETFQAIQGYVSSHKASIVWATRASQVGDVKDPRGAIVLGLARTLRNETSLPFFTIEVDETTSREAAASAIVKILHRAKSEHLNDHESIDTDYEYAVVKGDILIPRIHWQTISEASQTSHPGDTNEADETAPWRITMKTQGLLHTLAWSKGTGSGVLGEGEILVEARAVGLNFRVCIIGPSAPGQQSATHVASFKANPD